MISAIVSMATFIILTTKSLRKLLMRKKSNQMIKEAAKRFARKGEA